jgi:beta-phosphoglucomutase-like phosphatase (HAD superfamily)
MRDLLMKGCKCVRVASIEIAAKAVLFDMDGVVVDSRSVIEMAWREVVRKFDGRELTELEIRTVAHGRTPEQTIETLFPEYGDEQRQEI